MKPIETTNYLIRLLDPKDPDELREVQRLRYDFLLREFDEKKAESGGLDDDGYDAYTDSILAIDKRTGRIVGTYRLATARTLKARIISILSGKVSAVSASVCQFSPRISGSFALLIFI